uniref:G01D9.1 protein n=1 Tax=Caenorhabditis briggsae TaxID=6238 RepID=Q17306_CAEBR|nr:Similar to dihydropyrimidine dehydrogenase. This CDS is incomplete. The gene continues off the end of G01D9 [Caenorhabditis briggsae]
MTPKPNTSNPNVGLPLLSKDSPDIESLLILNPKVQSKANAVPSAVTKKNKHNWKRNEEKGCGASCGESKLKNDFRDIKHTTLSERGALKEAMRCVMNFSFLVNRSFCKIGFLNCFPFSHFVDTCDVVIFVKNQFS